VTGNIQLTCQTYANRDNIATTYARVGIGMTGISAKKNCILVKYKESSNRLADMLRPTQRAAIQSLRRREPAEERAGRVSVLMKEVHSCEFIISGLH
jgi:hypothetical protein